MVEVWAGLADLLLPAGCAGCRARHVPLRHGVCAACAAQLSTLRPRSVRPTPAPIGLPPCVALGEYDGALREMLLSYKERGRHGLARPLGTLLADVVAVATGGAPDGVLLIPVPATARAARTRHGDHLWRLARHATGSLRRAGWPALLARPLRALPRPDSATLDSAGRAAAAAGAFRIRAGRLGALRRAAVGRRVVVLDDIVTTGATLAAVSALLAGAGVPVDRAALIAATRRRTGPA
ncbi:Predicted amidophosphoribosyltransferases [Micromonospora pattaloongensis]|uniref:Predicted amidophosphoribosyltransferases n=1 Tax=Micromonospora pattaloongensis TaxID=405436 RepID=A0A1H3M3W1_9ACTN|nr:ComF family protein [Micromonospora pattaloongensis]SDY70909.1 Predicted amidophosphoribosyltransferases [Micromonospora pattaloongensis]